MPSPSFHWKGFGYTFLELLPEDQLLISMLIGANCNPPWNPKVPVGTSSSSLWLTPTIKPTNSLVFPWKELLYTSSVPTLMANLRNEATDHVALIVKVACIHESYRTMQIEKQF